MPYEVSVIERMKSSQGESYYSLDEGGTWEDFYTYYIDNGYSDSSSPGNFCIKAIVKGSEGGVDLPRTNVKEEPDDNGSKGGNGISIDGLIITAATDDASAGACTLDIETETLTLPSGYSIGAYSLNGGASWKTGDITANNGISKFLHKGGTLWLAKGYNKSTKASTVPVYKFPAILKRPTAPKLIPNYVAAHLKNGVADFAEDTQKKWTLTAKNSDTIIYQGILINESTDGKKPGPSWIDMPDGGIDVKELPLDGKIKKTVYFCRMQAKIDGSTIMPASKPVKLSVSSQQKPKALKIDYKKETMKGFADMGASFLSSVMSKDAARQAIDINNVTANGTLTSLIDDGSFTYWTAPTRNKPASPVVTYFTLARAVLCTETPGLSNGKLTLDRKYELYNGEKWGNLPRIEGASDEGYPVRVKATGKAVGKVVFTTGKWIVVDTTGTAASETGKLSYTWDMYTPADAGIAKSGVTSAYIESVDEYYLQAAWYDSNVNVKQAG